MEPLQRLRHAFSGSDRGERVRAVWNGATLAESERTVVVEGNHYFPREDVEQRYLEDSTKETVCPWKGVARYHTLAIAGERNEGAAWYYPDPSPAAAEIRDRIAFRGGVRVVPVDDGSEAA